jgi:hypothetical protein
MMGNVPAPGGGLGSNSNYFLVAENGGPLLDVKVTIDVTQDLVSNIGLGFQLNAYSLSGANSVIVQSSGFP